MPDDSRIHLMAFEPRGDVESVVYSVGLPGELQEALFELMGPARPDARLGTMRLREDLRCWLDRAVELRPVSRGRRVEDWLIGLAPIDLERLCNVMAVWVRSECGEDRRGLPAYGKVMSLLKPGTFGGHCQKREVRLFDAQGRPDAGCDGLTFPVFSAQVANTLVGKTLHLQNGLNIEISRIARGTDSAYELMTDVRWKDGDPWAFVLRFHVETLPVGRLARLNLDLVVRRFIGGRKWQETPFMPKSVGALVRDHNGTYRVVPYGYSSASKSLDWDARARQNYEDMDAGRLPAIGDYLDDIAAFARAEHSPQILSPYATSTPWAREPKVAPGASLNDKAMVFEAVAEALSNIVVPVAPLGSEKLAHLNRAYADADEALLREGDEQAESKHAAWAVANRRRLAECTGERCVTFQLMGTTADEALLGELREEIVYLLGDVGPREGVDVRIETQCVDQLLAPLESPGVASKKLRWRRIEGVLGKASGLTGCIVVLPGAAAFAKAAEKDSPDADSRDVDVDKPKRKGPSGPVDPKEAIRLGLARSGRLAQFLVPGEDAIGHRRRVAVLDLMRQMGFVPDYATRGGKLDLAVPVVGLYVYSSTNGGKKVRFPIGVRMEIAAGRILVDCPLFERGALPYWRAQLELARMSTDTSFKGKVDALGGGWALKRMVDCLLANAVHTETLLLVQAYGCIRWKDWWPGISDAGLDAGELRYGPQGGESPLNLRQGRLQVLRVRCGADGEVPDCFTDETQTESGAPARKSKQGLFRAQGYVLGLAGSPGDKQYLGSRYKSKFSSPQGQFCEKTLNEYCLLGSEDMDLAVRYAKYAEALRSGMVQLHKSDMSVNLPAPLHLAKKLEEYIWSGE